MLDDKYVTMEIEKVNQSALLRSSLQSADLRQADRYSILLPEALFAQR